MIQLILVAAAVAALLYWFWPGRRRAAAEPVAGPTPLDTSARLQALSPALTTVGDASSHPRDLQSNPTFREAVALLASADVSMGTVTDYATGANWMLATVACAALCERADKDTARTMM